MESTATLKLSSLALLWNLLLRWSYLLLHFCGIYCYVEVIFSCCTSVESTATLKLSSLALLWNLLLSWGYLLLHFCGIYCYVEVIFSCTSVESTAKLRLSSLCQRQNSSQQSIRGYNLAHWIGLNRENQNRAIPCKGSFQHVFLLKNTCWDDRDLEYDIHW